MRTLQKNADITNTKYKSYGSTSRKKKHENWSRSVHRIAYAKERQGVTVYRLVNGTRWYKPWELQQVTQVIKLEVPKQKLPKSRDVQKKIADVKSKVPTYRKTKHSRMLESDLTDYWKVERKRRRARVNYSGME